MLLAENLIIDGSLVLEGSLINDDFFEPNNFSFTKIARSIIETIKNGQQMIIDGSLVVEGQLFVEGQLSLISDSKDLSSGQNPYLIASGRTYSVKPFYEFLLGSNLLIEGSIISEGRMVIGG